MKTEKAGQMHRSYNLTHLILAGIAVLCLTPLMVGIDAQARIAFVSERDGNRPIYVMDADGRNPRNLTRSPRHDENPSWSPNGKRIAFTSARNDRSGNRQIYVMAADGENQQRLTKNDFNDENPSWYPNGKRIAFVSNRADDENKEIYVMNANGSNPRNLTNNPHHDTDPAWYDPAFAVAPAGKVLMLWGWLKWIDR